MIQIHQTLASFRRSRIAPRDTLTGFALGGLLALALGAPASGQLSKARGYINTVKSQGKILDSCVNRNPLDEPRILRATKQLRDASANASKAIKSFGATLAAAASSQYRDRLRAPNKLAKNLAYELGDNIVEKCDKLMELIKKKTQYGLSEFNAKVNTGVTGLIVGSRARSKDFEELTKKSNETLRWLRETLQATHAMNVDASKPVAALENAKEQVATKQREQATEIARLYNDWKACEDREAGARRRAADTRKVHDAARNAKPGPSYFSNAVRAYRDLLAAEREHKAATKRLMAASKRLDQGTHQNFNRLRELARLMNDLEKFQKRANPEAIARRLTDFDRWTKLLEKELQR